MPIDQALVGCALTGVRALLSQVFPKCKNVTSHGRDMVRENCVHTRVYVGSLTLPCSKSLKKGKTKLRIMRHHPNRVEASRQTPAMLHRASDAVSTGQKIYGVAQGLYTFGRAVAPYMAAAATAI